MRFEPHAVPHIQGHGVCVLGDLHVKGNPDLVLPQPIGEPANLCGIILVRKGDLVQLVACFGRCHSPSNLYAVSGISVLWGFVIVSVTASDRKTLSAVLPSS